MRNIGRSLIVAVGMLILAVSSVHADIWLNQDAEISTGTDNFYGDANSSGGRWGYLSTASGRVTTEQAHSGSRSLRARRDSEGRGSVQGYTDIGTFGLGAYDAKVFTLTLWVYREAGAGNVITFGSGGTDGAGAAWGTTGNPYVRTDGLVQLYTGSAYQSFSTGTTVVEDTWTELKFEYDLTVGIHGEVTASLNGTVLSTLALTTDFSLEAADRVTFNPQGATGTTVYFDDIQLEAMDYVPPVFDVWLNQDAEISTGTDDFYGDANSSGGRWGYLSTASGRVTTEQAHSGTRSLRARRGNEARGSVQGYTDIGSFGGAYDAKVFTLTLWVYREAGAGNVITFGSGGTDGADILWGTTGNAYVSTDGLVQLYTGSAYQSFSTGTTVVEDTWTELKFEYDLTVGIHGEVTASLDGTVLSTLALTTDFSLEAADRVTFNPQGATGTTVYFDDIQLEVIPEPAMLSFGRIEWTVGSLPFVDPGPSAGISGFAMVAHDGQIYLAGGFIPAGDETTDPSRRTSRWTYRYTPQTTDWTRLADMPERREYVRGIATDDAIYAVGGAVQMPGSTPDYMATDDCFKFDVSTLTWTSHSQLTVPRTHMAVGSVGNSNLVVIGGNEYALPNGYDDSTIRDTVDVLNLSDPSPVWNSRTPIPNGPRGWSASAVCNGRVYCFGGLTFPAGGGTTRFQETLSYDPAADSWDEHRPPPIAASGWEGAVFLNRYIILVGGIGSNESGSFWNNQLFVYDTTEDLWYSIDTPLPPAVNDHLNDPGVCIIGDKIYVAGAEGPDGSHYNHFLIGKIVQHKSGSILILK